MTIERNPDPDATGEPSQQLPEVDEELQDVDPEATLVREDWEQAVIRRVAPHVAAVQDELEGPQSFGWERAGLRRLCRELSKRELPGD